MKKNQQNHDCYSKNEGVRYHLKFDIERRVSERVGFFKCLPPFLVNLNCFIVTKLIILSSICQTVQSNCLLQNKLPKFA